MDPSRLWTSLFSAALIALPACGGDDAGDGAQEAGDTGDTGDETGESGQVFPLSDGTEVVVTDDGAVVMRIGGEDTFAIANVGPRVHDFSEGYFGVAAIYEIRRDSEVISPFPTLESAEADGDAVVVRYTGDAGAATLRIEPDATVAGEGTRFVLTPEGEHQSVALPVRCDAEGTFIGFGEQYNQLDQRGEAFPLIVQEQGLGRDPETEEVAPVFRVGNEHTTYFPMPYFLDARGWGFLVRTEHRVDVDVCLEDEGVAWFEVIDGAPFEGVLFHGPTTKDVVRELSVEVGRPQSPPSWAYDLWVGAQGGREQILLDLDNLEAAQVPVGALWVQDWTGIRQNLDAGFGVQYRWRPDEELYPDLAGMIDEIHQRGVRFLGYANPFIDPLLEHFDEMDEAGMLIRDPNNPDASYLHASPASIGSSPDLSNPDTQDYVRTELRNMVDLYGMDGWMTDFGEWIPLDAVFADGSDAVPMHNRFPSLWQRVNAEAMSAARPDGDWVMFARSGWTGVQRDAMLFWIGDQEATWETYDGLPTVVPALLNIGLAGIPIATLDIGGFSGGPRTKELWLRWTELGALTPVMRTHEGNEKEENWNWDSDAETTEHFRRFAEVHAALRPEFEALAAEAAESSVPAIRPLFMEFPEDPESLSVDDQFLIGADLLVAPVVDEGVTTQSVYLPPGTWFHVWTGDEYAGGQRVDVGAPIGSPPLFSRDADRADLRAIE